LGDSLFERGCRGDAGRIRIEDVEDVRSLVIAAVLGYLIGSIPFSYLVARFVGGVDLRKVGTRNIGGSNVATVTGRKWGLLAGVLDFSKGLLTPLVLNALGVSLRAQVLASFLVLIGHMWPVFLRFRGGRAVASAVGIALFFAPVQSLIGIAFAAVFMVIKEVALGVILAFVLLPILTAALGEPPWVTGLSLGILLLLILRRLWFIPGDLASGRALGSAVWNRILFDSGERRAGRSSAL
jgi:glycerol-3-phosphate acyltransferase PlsY